MSGRNKEVEACSHLADQTLAQKTITEGQQHHRRRVNREMNDLVQPFAALGRLKYRNCSKSRAFNAQGNIESPLFLTSATGKRDRKQKIPNARFNHN